jgi:hypothetical protein
VALATVTCARCRLAWIAAALQERLDEAGEADVVDRTARPTVVDGTVGAAVVDGTARSVVREAAAGAVVWASAPAAGTPAASAVTTDTTIARPSLRDATADSRGFTRGSFAGRKRRRLVRHHIRTRSHAGRTS